MNNSPKKDITTAEYHQANMMLFKTKCLEQSNTVLYNLTSIDSMSFLANGIEHHGYEKLKLTEYFTAVLKRNLILSFFNKMKMKSFDVLDVNTNIDFLFE